MSIYAKTKIYFKWLLKKILAIFLLVFISVLISIIVFELINFNKIYPGVKIGEYYMGGKTYIEAQDIIKKSNQKIMREGLNFDFEGRETNVSPIIISSVDSGLSYKILDFKDEMTAANVFAYGRNQEWYNNLLAQFSVLRDPKTLPNLFSLDKKELADILKENFSDFEREPVNAKPKILSSGEIEVVPEELGKEFAYEEAVLNLTENLAALQNDKVPLGLKTIFPPINRAEAAQAVGLVDELLTTLPLILAYGEEEWNLELTDLQNWLIFGKDLNSQKTILIFDKKLLSEYLENKIAPSIDIEVQNAKLEIENGRVTKFQASHDGRELNLEQSTEAINNLLALGTGSTVELAVDIIPTQVTTGDVNDLGIKEIVGVGQSDFSGSPVNRRHNIATGASIINGLLIKPEEEFSLIKALGKIDGEHGFKPELVIKGNRTIPEFGGGLCQVGTTMFRVILRSGLPVTERRPHSYRVSYYEPAGMDATIYNPHPDVRFINDTGHHLLLQTEINGDILSFTFWGTKDDRKILIDPDPPTIYNIIRPAPTKYIETLDLAPGVKKCTESSHNGATTEFNYTVTYPDGEIKEDFFKSVYVPWQAVCLVGVEELTPPEDPSASSGPSGSEE